MSRPRAWAAWLAGVAAAAGCTGPGSPDRAAGAPRLHHVHLESPDPAGSMEALARAHGCEKVILPGLGVGVRCGDAYVLFDRSADDGLVKPGADVSVDGLGEAATLRVSIDAADPAALQAWLSTTYGDAVTDRVTVASAESERRPASLLHLAIALPGEPSEAVVAGPGGLIVEQLRDEGLGPDAFWCPMHPDVRSAAGGVCPRCGMALVPIPEPAARDYRLDVDFQPTRTAGGRMRLAIRDADTGDRLTSFVALHERLLHLFVISRTLDVFLHLHPTLQPDGRFSIDFDLPRDDAYMLVTDVHPAGGTPALLQTLWVSPGYRGDPFPDGTGLEADRTTKTSGSVRVALTTDRFAAGAEQAVAFRVTDARGGGPVTDLEPYLGASGHLVVASADLGDIVHSHPVDVAGRGPDVPFEVTFPRPGRYKLWVQVQRRGAVELASFIVDAR